MPGVIFFERLADGTGALVKARRAIMLDGATIDDVPDGVLTGDASAPGSVTGYTRVRINVAPGDLTVSGNLTVDGTIVQGPWTQKTATVTTVGAAVGTAVTIPVATGRATSLWIAFGADDGTYGYLWESGHSTGVTTFGGTPTFNLASPASINGFPLSPSYAVTWAAGTLSFTPTGPNASITGTADNGSGKLRLTLSSVSASSPVTSAITGQSVTIAGLSGTPGGNGAHVATYVDGTHIDIASVAYVAPDASGTLAMTTPQTVTWKIRLAVM